MPGRTRRIRQRPAASWTTFICRSIDRRKSPLQTSRTPVSTFKETSHQGVLTSYNPGLATPRNPCSRWRIGNLITNSTARKLRLEAEFDTCVSLSGGANANAPGPWFRHQHQILTTFARHKFCLKCAPPNDALPNAMKSCLPLFAPGLVPLPGLRPGRAENARPGAFDSESPLLDRLAVSLGLPG